ncbi:hypothetical protein JMJ77_0010826 [Colletotrichum scovillei]|uniref:Uncharacterized protein n=1 Tax=Colletotrichum scovillei TaxID=1209932 RepID=A0A9P7R3D6_9PEZI|nr:hypothetical protein JMJ77_0010826 [Colletotrichum scovillei]KAG7059791.1 hypothetical protein JMJ78_0015080 [Colletotrichum scovillei]KAG7067239.1 hypothetical protein JMJ76_0008682 [Colletotrichum scovillei]
MANYSPSSKTPLMDGVRVDMLKVLDRGDSLYELTLCFPDIANELIAAGMTKQPDCTIAQLRLDHARGWETTEVLHIIPRDLLRSIIKGTVAMDFGPNRPHDYDEDSSEAGIYVIAVSVDGRDGKFLNWSELGELTTALQTYADAYTIHKRGAPRGITESVKTSIAKEIDLAVNGQWTAAKTRFICNDTQHQHVMAFIENLQRRRTPMFPGVAEAAIHQEQCPLYIGCSSKLNETLPKYSLSTNLGGINNLLALLISALRHMGLEPAITRRVVMITWKRTQLPVAERLVIALARSYVLQDGCNIAEGGANRSGYKYSLDAETSVSVHSTAMEENLTASQRDIRDRKECLQNLQEAKAIQENNVKLAVKMEEDMLQIEKLATEWTQIHQPRLDKRKEELDRAMREAAKARPLWEELDELLSQVVEALRKRGP